ncbi:MAG: SH3 domain-containing protein, partial [Oscillospiraceae bacterium]|nr:SH3 domain-containing protein [Oscillospiraceae bacterium]
MKKLICITLCLLMAFSLLAGCASSHKQVEGILHSFSGSLIELTATTGETLVFSLPDALINTSTGMVAGDDIVVVYDGNLNGSDTSGVTVVSVEDKSQSALPEGAIGGTLTDATMNTVTIQTAQGVSYTFTTTNAQIDVVNGLVLGNYVEVYYQGTLHSNTDTSDIHVYRVVDNDENLDPEDPTPIPTETPTPASPSPTTIPQEGQPSLPVYSSDPAKQPDFGIVFHEVDQDVWATASINVRVGPGDNYRRITGLIPQDKVRRTGYSDNGWSRIFLDGYTAYTYSDYLTGGAPTPTPTPTPTPKPPTPVVYHTMEGYVIDATMNTLEIGDDTGYYDWNTAGAEHHYKNGICIGNFVKIE